MSYLKSYFIVSFILTLISYLSPNDSYRKYMKYFIGILMAVMVIRPIFFIAKFEISDNYIRNWEQIEEITNSFDVDGREHWFEEFIREKAKED